MAYTPEQLQALRNQLYQAQQQATLPYNDRSGASGVTMGSHLGQGGMSMAQHQAARDNVTRLSGLLGQAGGGSVDPMQQSLDKIRQLTEGRSTELANDPYQKSVMDFLQGVTTGKDVPFTNEVQGAMLAQQGRGSADAEAAQMASMRENLAASGGSIYDPSYQAASREALSQRQGRNLDAAGQMAATAGVQNFNARMGGAGQLSAARNAQNAQINQMNLAGAGYRARESRETGGQPMAMFSSMQVPAPAAPQASSGPWEGFTGQTSGSSGMVVGPKPATPVAAVGPASVGGASQNVQRPPTPAELNMPWNVQNLNPYAKPIIRPNPNDQPYSGRSPY